MAQYTATFTATDATSTGSNELSYQIRDAASGGGNLLIDGTCTAGVEHTTGTITDNGLSHGSNSRYIRIFDGADNLYETSFSVEYELYLSSAMPTGGSATITLSGIAPYIWSEMPTGGEATVTLDGIVPFIWSEMPTGGSATATLNGLALIPFISSPMSTGGGATVTLNGIVYPVIAAHPYSRPVAVPLDLINVLIYRPLNQYVSGSRTPLDTLDINPNVTALSWSSGLPGGWSTGNVGIEHPNAVDRYGEPLRRPWLTREPEFGSFYHVEFRKHGRTLFAGRMQHVVREYGVVTGFTVSGYGQAGTRDMYYRNSSTTAVSSGTILRAMIAATAPHLVAAPDGDLWQDPGVAHQYDEFNRMYLADVLDQIALEGDSAGNLVDWTVYEDQVVQLRTRTQPDQPHYVVPWSMVPSHSTSSAALIGAASFERNNGGSPVGSSTDYTDPAFVETHGFQRGEMLQLGEVTAAAGIALTRAYLERYSRPTVSASIVAGPGDTLADAYGRVMPKEEARAGQWVQIEGETMLVVLSTDYDATSDILRMEAGEPVQSFETLIASLQRDRLRLQRKINLRGGRDR